jgi:hypothetical protein
MEIRPEQGFGLPVSALVAPTPAEAGGNDPLFSPFNLYCYHS